MSDPYCVYSISFDKYKDAGGFCQSLQDIECKHDDGSAYKTYNYGYCKDPTDYRCVDVSIGSICRNPVTSYYYCLDISNDSNHC